ncbi:MAG: hypothetical protein JWN76_1903 [Chitinophagaceae bacterium]|nr:hypothetical protein [Chitinophagaceae bacterium]
MKFSITPARKYLRIAYIFVLLITPSQFCSAQTRIFIIGCQHNTTKNFTADTISEVLKNIKPDIILMELDSSLMDASGNFKHFFSSNENDAVRKYQSKFPAAQLRRFDFEGRNAYFASTRLFQKEQVLWKLVDSLYFSNHIEGNMRNILAAHYNATNALNNLDQLGIKTLNSAEYLSLSKFRQNWMYHEVLQVIGATEVLKPFYEFYKSDGNFWEFRNKTMSQNILKYIKEFKQKTIVILVGSYHKYMLMDLLQPEQKQGNFVISEFSY